MSAKYLPDATYSRLVQDLQGLSGPIDRQQIIDALASADVWPAYCWDDSANHQNGTASGRTMSRTNHRADDDEGRQ